MKLNWPEGLNEKRFLDEYWQQKPLLLRNAFDNFDNPLDPNELAGLACEEDSNARYIEHTGNNEWRMCAGPLSDDFFDDVEGCEWSLLVSDVEKLLPEFQRYLQPFRFLPNWRIDDLMISYAPVGGSVGAHVDQYDVFLLQADGIREWQIESSPRGNNENSVSQTIALLGDFKADETWQLQRGDMLYLPPQYAHHGIAKDEPCMTWSIGFRAPSVEEMLPDISRYLLETDNAQQRFTDPARATATNPGLIQQTDLDSLKDMLKQTLEQNNTTLYDWIGRFITEPKDTTPEPELEETSVEQLTDKLKAGLHCNSHKRVAYSLIDKTATLYADGNSYPCSQTMAQAIADRRLVTPDDIIDSSDIELLTTLCRQQVLLPLVDQ